MKPAIRNVVAILFASALLVVTFGTAQQAPIGYRFDDVKRTVVLRQGTRERNATKGVTAQSGDSVHTGWFAYALIASPQHRARFEVFSNSDVQLAGDTPGVILSLERGRIHAMFDKITGSEPRIVKTPGALLAVRGTQYTVEVDKAGETSLEVSDGIVEIRSELRPEPLMVRAGEGARFSRREPPTPHQSPGNRPTDPEHPNEGDRRDPGHAPGSDHGGGPQPPHGGPPPGPQPRPPHP